MKRLSLSSIASLVFFKLCSQPSRAGLYAVARSRGLKETMRKIIAAMDDMFFVAKIRATAEQLNIDVRFVRSEDTAIEACMTGQPALIIADLHSQKISAVELAKKLKRDERLKNIHLLGFFSHVQMALREEALAAGFDEVIPRSAFSKNLAQILQG